VLQGRVDGIDLIFAPTPPQLAKVCRERTEDMQHIRFKRSNEGVQERLKMLPAPAPPVMTPEEAEAAQRRIDAKVEAAKASIIVDVAGDRWVKEKAETERAAFDAIAQAARKRHREEPK
jgi:predicted DNA-binding transcriptional regulator YafY